MPREKADKHTFSPAEDKTLIRLNAKGWTDAQIAQELGLTRAQIGDRRRRLKIPAVSTPTLWTAQNDAELVRLKAQGKSYAQVAAELGRTHDSVKTRYQRIRRPEQRTHPRQRICGNGEAWSAREDAKLRQWREEGISWVEISRRLGRKPGACQSRQRRMRWHELPQDADLERREIEAGLVRAENAARWHSYTQQYKISSADNGWQPGDPIL